MSKKVTSRSTMYRNLQHLRSRSINNSGCEIEDPNDVNSQSLFRDDSDDENLEDVASDSQLASNADDFEISIPMDEERSYCPSECSNVAQGNPKTTTTISKIASAVSVVAAKNNLTDSCIEDILKLMRYAHLNANTSEIPSSNFTLNHHLGKTDPAVDYYWHCRKCNAVKSSNLFKSPLTAITCCGVQPKYTDDHFIIFDIKHLLRVILPLVVDKRMSETSETKNDIIYNNFFLQYKTEVRYDCKTDYTLVLNTDGAPLWKSSRVSMWPVLAVINEIDPYYRKKYVLLLGMWIGKSKPQFKSLLSPVIEQLNDIQSGFYWTTLQGNTIRCKVFTIATLCDSPARPAVQFMSQWNSTFGCGYCIHKEPGHFFSHDNEFTPRSSILHMQHVQAAETYGEKDPRACGVKGRSPFMDLHYFNIIEGFPPDIMHAVYLGVTQHITTEMITSRNSDKPFHIGGVNLDFVNKTLENIQPPKRVNRHPRSLNESASFKASEWQMWLLYYSPLILKEVLPANYYQHWLWLVKGITILTGEEITNENADLAGRYLELFSKDIVKLYGPNQNRFNIHLLLHLKWYALKYGPLQNMSMKTFESFNGKLKSYIKSSKGIGSQVAKRYYKDYNVEYHQMESSELALFVNSINSKTATASCEIAGYQLFRTANANNLNEHEKKILDTLTVCEGGQGECYQRVRSPKKLVHYSKGCSTAKTNTRCAKLFTGDYFETSIYVAFPSTNRAFAIGRIFITESFNAMNCALPHISIIHSYTPKYFDVKQLENIVMKLDVGEVGYICEFLNSVDNNVD